jgi:hypothetical protein
MLHCVRKPGCVAVSFSEGPVGTGNGDCYLKNAITPATDVQNPHIVSALMRKGVQPDAYFEDGRIISVLPQLSGSTGVVSTPTSTSAAGYSTPFSVASTDEHISGTVASASSTVTSIKTASVLATRTFMSNTGISSASSVHVVGTVTSNSPVQEMTVTPITSLTNFYPTAITSSSIYGTATDEAPGTGTPVPAMKTLSSAEGTGVAPPVDSLGVQTGSTAVSFTAPSRTRSRPASVFTIKVSPETRTSSSLVASTPFLLSASSLAPETTSSQPTIVSTASGSSSSLSSEVITALSFLTSSATGSKYVYTQSSPVSATVESSAIESVVSVVSKSTVLPSTSVTFAEAASSTKYAHLPTTLVAVSPVTSSSFTAFIQSFSKSTSAPWLLTQSSTPAVGPTAAYSVLLMRPTAHSTASYRLEVQTNAPYGNSTTKKFPMVPTKTAFTWYFTNATTAVGPSAPSAATVHSTVVHASVPSGNATTNKYSVGGVSTTVAWHFTNPTSSVTTDSPLPSLLGTTSLPVASNASLVPIRGKTVIKTLTRTRVITATGIKPMTPETKLTSAVSKITGGKSALAIDTLSATSSSILAPTSETSCSGTSCSDTKPMSLLSKSSSVASLPSSRTTTAPIPLQTSVVTKGHLTKAPSHPLHTVHWNTRPIAGTAINSPAIESFSLPQGTTTVVGVKQTVTETVEVAMETSVQTLHDTETATASVELPEATVSTSENSLELVVLTRTLFGTLPTTIVVPGPAHSAVTVNKEPATVLVSGPDSSLATTVLVLGTAPSFVKVDTKPTTVLTPGPVPSLAAVGNKSATVPIAGPVPSSITVDNRPTTVLVPGPKPSRVTVDVEPATVLVPGPAPSLVVVHTEPTNVLVSGPASSWVAVDDKPVTAPVPGPVTSMVTTDRKPEATSSAVASSLIMVGPEGSSATAAKVSKVSFGPTAILTEHPVPSVTADQVSKVPLSPTIILTGSSAPSATAAQLSEVPFRPTSIPTESPAPSVMTAKLPIPTTVSPNSSAPAVMVPQVPQVHFKTSKTVVVGTSVASLKGTQTPSPSSRSTVTPTRSPTASPSAHDNGSVDGDSYHYLSRGTPIAINPSIWLPIGFTLVVGLWTFF